MAAATEWQNFFAISGPRHLVNPDWLNPTHRRSIAASLVKAVYLLEKDRQEKRYSLSNALAPSWWTFFNFHLTERLVDSTDGSIFAAVFENRDAAETSAPAVVVAFRGTIFEPESLGTDLKLDLLLITNGLHKTFRFNEAINAIRSSIVRHGHRNVWLAGHSLGAALAMVTGREICEVEGFHLECHLFNPPFPSVPVDSWITNEKLKLGIHVAHSFVTAGLAATFKERGRDAHDAFDVLQEWIPNLYVNPCDDICSGYVGYFGNREQMQDFGLGKIVDIAARHSINDCIISAFGEESKASHLIPSARLILNVNPSSEIKKAPCCIQMIYQWWSEFKKAHGIHQWLSPELQFRCTLFTMGNPALDMTGRNEVSSKDDAG